MKKSEERKVSLVEFLGSLKFNRGSDSADHTECSTHFAAFNPRAPRAKASSSEDYQLVRSAN
tara:strand:+ start:204557 stop:204742 length:186 start_codon:yes stop_codon:yes gene_type:complete